MQKPFPVHAGFFFVLRIARRQLQKFTQSFSNQHIHFLNILCYILEKEGI
jgi:hypothetical protein